MSLRAARMTVNLFIFLILTATGVRAAGIPTLIQHVQGTNSLGHQGPLWLGGPNNTYTIFLPNPTQAGNCIIVGMRFDNTQAPTITVSDDKSNVYNIGNVTTDAANENKYAIYYAINVTAGTRKIQVTLTSSSAAVNFAVMASEFDNVATVSALDGNAGTFSTGTSIAAGSMTPSASGDLVYQFATQGTGASVTYTAGVQANITWSLLSADLQKPFAAQYGVYNSAAAFNPTVTQSSNVNFETSAIMLKSATAGGPPPAGMTINRIEHNSLWSTYTNGPGYSNAAQMQFPSVGPLLIAATTTGGGTTGGDITGVTDNNGNTWVSCGPGLSASNHNEHFYYVANAKTGSNEMVTVASSNTESDSTVVFYDISGASASPCDTSAAASGDQSSPVSVLVGPTITPSTSNGLILGELQQWFGTVVSMSGTNMMLDSVFYSQENLDGPENVDQNGGFAHYYNPNTSPVPFKWGFELDSTNPSEGYWTCYVAAFKAGTIPPAPPTNVNVINIQ